MPTYAVIKDGKVVGISRLSGNIVKADHVPVDEATLETAVILGATWDGKKFTPPAQEEPGPPPVTVSEQLATIVTDIADIKAMVKRLLASVK